MEVDLWRSFGDMATPVSGDPDTFLVGADMPEFMEQEMWSTPHPPADGETVVPPSPLSSVPSPLSSASSPYGSSHSDGDDGSSLDVTGDPSLAFASLPPPLPVGSWPPQLSFIPPPAAAVAPHVVPPTPPAMIASDFAPMTPDSPPDAAGAASSRSRTRVRVETARSRKKPAAADPDDGSRASAAVSVPVSGPSPSYEDESGGDDDAELMIPPDASPRERQELLRRHRRLVKNRQAAQESRQRKKAYMSNLQQSYDQLVSRTATLDQSYAAVSSENATLRAQVRDLMAALKSAGLPLPTSLASSVSAPAEPVTSAQMPSSPAPFAPGVAPTASASSHATGSSRGAAAAGKPRRSAVAPRAAKAAGVALMVMLLSFGLLLIPPPGGLPGISSTPSSPMMAASDFEQLGAKTPGGAGRVLLGEQLRTQAAVGPAIAAPRTEETSAADIRALFGSSPRHNSEIDNESRKAAPSALAQASGLPGSILDQLMTAPISDDEQSTWALAEAATRERWNRTLARLAEDPLSGLSVSSPGGAAAVGASVGRNPESRALVPVTTSTTGGSLRAATAGSSTQSKTASENPVPWSYIFCDRAQLIPSVVGAELVEAEDGVPPIISLLVPSSIFNSSYVPPDPQSLVEVTCSVLSLRLHGPETAERPGLH